MHFVVLFLFSTVMIWSYFEIVLTYIVNVPWWDDYDVIIKFINNFKETQDPLILISDLFHQHNEHRLVVPKLIFKQTKGIRAPVIVAPPVLWNFLGP